MNAVSSVMALVGWIAICIGIGWLAGAAWALIAAGVLMITTAILLYDPKAEK